MSIFKEVIAVIVKMDILEITAKQVRKYNQSFVFLYFVICIGNQMNASSIKDLHYE